MWYLKFLCIFIMISTNTFAASLLARGAAIGMPFGAISKPGFSFDSIGFYFSEPGGSQPSTNVMSDVIAIDYVPKTRWIDNQFHFVLAPGFGWVKGPLVGRSWHYGITSPLFLGGLTHEIAPGIGFSNLVGGMAPMRAGVADLDAWLFANVSSVSYTRDDYNVTMVVIYGHPGNNLSKNTKIRPNFLNMDFTATRKLSGIEIGPIWYSSQDLNTNHNQQQFAMGGLIGFDVAGWVFQFWLGHDLYAYGYPQQMMNGYFRLKTSF